MWSLCLYLCPSISPFTCSQTAFEFHLKLIPILSSNEIEAYTSTIILTYWSTCPHNALEFHLKLIPGFWTYFPFLWLLFKLQMKWKLIYPRSKYLLTDLHVRIMLLNFIWRLSPGSGLVLFFCGFFLSFKWNGNLFTLGLNTYWSVCIMLLKSIWSLSPGSGLVF